MELIPSSPTSILQSDDMQYASSVVDSKDLQRFSELNGFSEDVHKDTTVHYTQTRAQTTTYNVFSDNGGGIEEYEEPVAHNAEYHAPSKLQSVKESTCGTTHAKSFKPDGKSLGKFYTFKNYMAGIEIMLDENTTVRTVVCKFEAVN